MEEKQLDVAISSLFLWSWKIQFSFRISRSVNVILKASLFLCCITMGSRCCFWELNKIDMFYSGRYICISQKGKFLHFIMSIFNRSSLQKETHRGDSENVLETAVFKMNICFSLCTTFYYGWDRLIWGAKLSINKAISKGGEGGVCKLNFLEEV